MINKRVNDFLSLRCAGDVLSIVQPLGSKASKEISESMSMIRHLKDITLKEPMRYRLVDLCAGNALTSVLAVHLLPIREAVAVDIRPRKRNWEAVSRFQYIERDIRDIRHDFFTNDDIILSVHPCKLAVEIAIMYQRSPASHLLMMPCCEGSVPKKYKSQFLIDRLGKYGCWCLYLSDLVGGDIFVDNHCLSPKNIIIRA